MAHILYKLGAAALKPRQVGDKVLPPLIGYAQAMKLREQFYKEQQHWPYEDLVPGPAQPPAGAEDYLRRKAVREEKKQQRLGEIAAAMAKMPSLIEQYKASRRSNFDWNEVDLLDLLTLERRAVRQKYLRRKMLKQSS